MYFFTRVSTRGVRSGLMSVSVPLSLTCATPAYPPPRRPARRPISAEFDECSSLMDSLQGQLLIATQDLLDPNFARTVVLIAVHGEEGALGLILNREIEHDASSRSGGRSASRPACARERPARRTGQPAR